MESARRKKIQIVLMMNEVLLPEILLYALLLFLL